MSTRAPAEPRLESAALHVHALIDSLTWGGAETLLADFATALRDRGDSLSVGYLNRRSQAAERLREQGVEPELVEIKSMLGPRDQKLVREHLRAVSPDLLHTHLGYSDFLGGRAARALGIPTVATLHVMEWEQSLRENTKARLMALARRHCAARVIAVSEAARGRYLDTGWDLPERVVTVHNGIAGTRREGAGQAIREQLGLRADELVVAMVSVLRPGKGHDVAAQAIASLRERFPKLRLLVLGDGPDREAVLDSLRPAGDAVLAPGFRPDVLAVLDGVDVLIHPSRVDALPTALIEAMAAEVPVIASDVGGIPEIVVDGETGILLDSPLSAAALSGALAKLLEEPERRARMGAAGRERFERQFALEPWLDRLDRVYEVAIREQGNPRGSRTMGPVQTRLEREQEFHDRTFDEDGRSAASKFYEVDRPGVERYRELLLRHGSDRRVLEYGCGPGSSAFALARAGAEVHGIDISEVAIRQATERAKREGVSTSCHFRREDAERTSFPDEHFGLVCGSGIIHHLDLAAAYREVARVLAADGRAVFLEPLGHNPAINAYRRRTPELRTVDEHPLRVEDLELAAEHFESVEVEYFNLLTLLAVPARGTRVFQPVLKSLHRADQTLFRRVASSRKHAWMALISLGGPRASAPTPA